MTTKSIIAAHAATVLACLAENVDPEGPASELLEAMGAAGCCNPNNAYLFEANPGDGRLQVLNDTEGWTLLVDPATGEVVPAPEDEVTMPGPAAVAAPDPVEYFRILVNRGAHPFFRTSRLHNAASMFDALSHMRFGFSHGEDASQYALSVLSVNASGVGHICGDAELAALADSVQDVA